MRNNSTWALSALSPTPWPREAFGLPLTLLALVGTVFFATVPGVAYVLVGIATHAFDAHQLAHLPAEQLLIAQIVAYLPLGIYLVVILPKLARVSLAVLGVTRPNARQLAIGATGTLAMVVLVNLGGAAIEALSHRHDTETAIQLLKAMKTPGQQILFFVVACVLAPMIEELTFRVFIFNALARYVSIPVAIVVSGAIFGLVHAGSPSQLITIAVPLALGGMVLAFVYARTRNYWASVTTHALFNAIPIVSIFVFHAKP